MKKKASLLAVLCFFAATFARVVTAQDIPNVAGTWHITIHNFGNTPRPPGQPQARWVLEQDGTKIKGIGGERFNLEGTLTGRILRVEVTDPKNSAMHNQVHATVGSDSIDGAVRMGRDEYIWQASRHPASERASPTKQQTTQEPK